MPHTLHRHRPPLQIKAKPLNINSTLNTKHINGFSFIELCLVLFCVCILTSSCVFSIRYVQKSHRAEVFAQELLLLRNALATYKEMYGTMPTIAEGKLSSSAFEKLQPYWYPFNPDHSSLDGYWSGVSSSTLNNIYLIWKSNKSDSAAIDFALVNKKISKMFVINETTGKCYIFKEPN